MFNFATNQTHKTMKSIHLLSTAALMMLLMCCSNKPAPAQQAASENKASVAETMDEDTPTTQMKQKMLDSAWADIVSAV